MDHWRAAAIGLGLAVLLIPGSGHAQVRTFQSPVAKRGQRRPFGSAIGSRYALMHP